MLKCVIMKIVVQNIKLCGTHSFIVLLKRHCGMFNSEFSILKLPLLSYHLKM